MTDDHGEPENFFPHTLKNLPKRAGLKLFCGHDDASHLHGHQGFWFKRVNLDISGEDDQIAGEVTADANDNLYLPFNF